MTEIVDSTEGWVAKHVARYVATDGADGHLYNGYPVLLLTTLGRRSGQWRRTALIYGRSGEDYLVVASNGGSAKHPLWYSNLAVAPEVQVQVLADRFTATARTATGDERAAMWETVVGVFPTYARYQRETEREIPVVVLSRR